MILCFKETAWLYVRIIILHLINQRHVLCIHEIKMYADLPALHFILAMLAEKVQGVILPDIMWAVLDV